MPKAKDISKNKTERQKLLDIFNKIPEEKKQVVEKLIENAGFMAEQLEILQEYISAFGCTESYQNGANQFGKKKSSEVEVYNAMIKNYSSVIKQLLDLLPQEEKTSEDELLNFIAGGGTR